jgi:Fe-S cluster assembly protein SufD
MSLAAAETDLYPAHFRTLAAELPGSAALMDLRRDALDHFEDLGFPTTRMEEWRFTNVAPIARTPFRPAPAYRPGSLDSARVRSVAADLFGETAGSLLVFVDGHYASDLSTMEPAGPGVRVGSLADALDAGAPDLEPHIGGLADHRERAFVALNTAFFEDGALVQVDAGCVVEKPMRILFLASPTDKPVISQPRNLYFAGAGSQVSIVEGYAGLDDSQGVSFTNAVTEVLVGDNATLAHYRVQKEPLAAYHVSALFSRQGSDSRVRAGWLSVGGSIVRTDVRSVMAGEGGELHLGGLYLARGRQHTDSHTFIDHAMPHCDSREVYHGVMDDSASAVFSGKIMVRQDAQKTDARQTNRNLLLSDEATIDTKPQLEIYADDVKCTHGATVGQLDEEALFYLRARGIPRQEARSMLTLAFASEVISQVGPEALRERLESLVFRWLEREQANA